MPTAKKVAEVEELSDRIGRSTIAIGADYRGLSVKQMTDLRRALRQAGVELRVVKNTLMRLASDKAGRNEFLEIVQGPTAIAFAYGNDVVAPAKALTDFIRTSRLEVALYGAFVEGQVLDRRGIEDLASVPPKEVLLAKIAGALISPAAELAGLLSATLREFVSLVNARSEQLDASGEPTSAEAPTAQSEPATEASKGEAAEVETTTESADEAASPPEAQATEAPSSESTEVEEPSGEEAPAEAPAEGGAGNSEPEPPAEQEEQQTEQAEGDQ